MGQQQSLDGSYSDACKQCPLIKEVEQLREECKRLQELSITDPMTGFYNYRYLMEALDNEMERTRRTGLHTALILIDLDYFKRINDTYGHPAGDEALRWACRIWREDIRRIDVPCRYGGEEFGIILPGTSIVQAVGLAERLRAILEASPISFGSRKVLITASFGVASYSGERDDSPQSLIDSADQFLLRAKAKGRNRVCSELDEPDMLSTGITVEEREALFGSERKAEDNSSVKGDDE